MSVRTQYYVEVQINQKIFERFGASIEYDRKACEATKGSIQAGSNCYAKVFHWATFDNYKDARACEMKLMDMGYYFAAKLL